MKNKKAIFLDSFSGDAVDLRGNNRTGKNVISKLLKNPKVSTFDMSENMWLVTIIDSLKKRELIIEQDEPYPWHRYKVTKEGRAFAA